jgi:hypothetical protein
MPAHHPDPYAQPPRAHRAGRVEQKAVRRAAKKAARIFMNKSGLRGGTYAVFGKASVVHVDNGPTHTIANIKIIHTNRGAGSSSEPSADSASESDIQMAALFGPEDDVPYAEGPESDTMAQSAPEEGEEEEIRPQALFGPNFAGESDFAGESSSD